MRTSTGCQTAGCGPLKYPQRLSRCTMRREESELRIVGKPEEGTPAAPKGFRIAKVVRMPESGVYFIPIPGAMPPGLKLSFHPSGEFHLKSRDDGTIARVNLYEVARAIANGRLEQLLLSLLRAPAPGLRAKGVLVPPTLSSKFSGSTGPSATGLALAADDLAALSRVEIDDTIDLREDIEWLRREGLLPARAILILQIGETEQPAVFVSVGDQPNAVSDRRLPPPGSPMGKAFTVLVGMLEKYGGIWVTFPGEDEMRQLLEQAGFAGFFEGLEKWAESLGEKISIEDALAGPMIGVLAGSSVMSLLEQPPLRPGTSRQGSDTRDRASKNSPG